MNLRFLGSASSTPNVGNDSPCFLINERYLVDCGYNVLGALRKNNCDVSKIDHIILTHLHHDHYIGLAGLIFYMLQAKARDISTITIIGPEDLPDFIERLYAFLMLDKFYLESGKPIIKAVKAGNTVETEDAIITVGECYHPVPARCYRFDDKNDGKCLAISGDTAYKKDMALLFKGADALIHDCTLGANILNDEPSKRACGHSSLYEAVALCKEADIPILFPMHMDDEVALEAINTVQPSTDTVIKFPNQNEDYILY